MLLETRDLIRFEGYVVDRSGWTLKWEQETIGLNRKSFDLLVYLIDHRDRVCSKDELLAALWPDQFIEESNLTQQIFLLRKALSRHESGKKIIETVSGRGYRFTVPVEMEQRYAPQERLQQQVVVSSSETVTQITIEEEELEAHGDASAALTLDTRTTRQPLTVPEHSLTTGGPSTETRPRSLGRTVGPPAMRWLVGIAGVLVLLAVYLAMQWDDPARLRVSTYAQITSDGRAKSIGGTDGSRIYFTQLQTGGVAEVSVSGGVEAPVQLGIEDPWSGDVSPDGSTLLIISQAGGQGPANSLWSFRLVGGAIHHLADSVVSSAWSPDGEKTVNASANGDIFVMGRDGSDAHRIASPGGYLKSLAWSPNGKTIRFSKDGLLWEIALDGTNLHQLLPDGAIRRPNGAENGRRMDDSSSSPTARSGFFRASVASVRTYQQLRFNSPSAPPFGIGRFPAPKEKRSLHQAAPGVASLFDSTQNPASSSLFLPASRWSSSSFRTTANLWHMSLILRAFSGVRTWTAVIPFS